MNFLNHSQVFEGDSNIVCLINNTNHDQVYVTKFNSILRYDGGSHLILWPF